MADIQRVLFVGSKPLGLRILEEIHALAPDRIAGALTFDDSQDARSAFGALSAYCTSRDLPLHVASSRSDAEGLIQRIRPDLCIVAGWYWLIGDQTLESVPAGFIGIHNSLLPRYRGGSPLVWTILNGDAEAGVSLFSLTPGMDEGSIWAQGTVPVGESDAIGDVIVRLEERAVDLLRGVFPSILDGTARPTEQDHRQATYCAQRMPEDGEIDWRKTARQVHDFIRAQSHPYPGAFTYLEGSVLRVWSSRLFEPPYFGIPGQVGRIQDGEVYVICGDDHAVVLTDAEFLGRRGRPGDFVRSIRTRFPSAR